MPGLAGKIGNRDESGYDIAWCPESEPYTALLNWKVPVYRQGHQPPAGARLFIRYVTGGADRQERRHEALQEGRQLGSVRDDVGGQEEPAQLTWCRAPAPMTPASAIYDIYLDVQEMWTHWLSQNLKMK